MKYIFDKGVIRSTLWIKSNVTELDDVPSDVWDLMDNFFVNTKYELVNNSIFTLLNNNLIVELSSDKPQTEYGKIDIDDVKKIIDDLINKYPFLKDLLERIKELLECEEDEQNNECLRALEKILKDLNKRLEEIQDKECKKEIKDAIKKIKQRKHKGMILGEYIHSLTEPKVILYCYNIEKCGYSEYDMYKRVFAHELFHAVHYYFKHMISGNSFDYMAHKITIESLASYFEQDYCIAELANPSMADEIKATWAVYDAETYPYAGAIDFYLEDDFLKVFFASVKEHEEYILEYCIFDNNPIDFKDSYVDYVKDSGVISACMDYYRAINKVLKMFNIENVNRLLYSLSRDFKEKYDKLSSFDDFSAIVLEYLTKYSPYYDENVRSHKKLSSAINKLVEYTKIIL